MDSDPDLETDTESSEDSIDNAFIQKYFSELQQFSLGIDEIKRRAITGALRVSRLRSIAWAILLEVIPPEREKWLSTLRTNREDYEELKKRITCNPHVCELPEDNPLSQNDESVWNQHFRDNDLRDTIKLDVIRTFPGVEFFTLPNIREAMINVLFCFARETPSLIYRQGMHEILAPLMFVLQSDHQMADHVTNDEIKEIMNPDFLEHDSYSIFKIIMERIEKFYTVQEIAKLVRSPCSRNVNSPITDNEIIQFIGDGTDNLLSKEDSALAEYLRKCDIPLCIFGLRWLRLLFGREFPLHDLLLLWDTIFANNDFTFTGYVIVAMLIAIKSLLMTCEPIMALTHLMQYPASVDVQYIIDHALYLKYPEVYCKPAVRIFTFNIKKNPHLTHHRQIISNKNKNILKKYKNIETALIKDQIEGLAVDSGIIDGLQEPTSLRNELYYAHAIMTTGFTKLDHYAEVLRQTIPSTLPLSHPAYQALNGLKEVSELLKSRQLTQALPEIESALEANESESPPSKGKLKGKKSTKPSSSTKSTSLPNNEPKDVPLEVYKFIDKDITISGAPKLDPLGLHED